MPSQKAPTIPSKPHPDTFQKIRNSRQEARRLAELQNYNILDTPADGAFDRVTALAATIFDTPVSLVSLVDADRIWFKSHHGLDVEEVDRAPGLCASVIMSDEAYVVENAVEDPRTLANPLVAGELGLRFYAATPLVTSQGFRLGTINVLDFEPRSLRPGGEAILHDLAGLIMDQMELRLSSRVLVERLCETFEEQVERTKADQLMDDQMVTICAWTKRVKIDGQWLSFEEFITQRLGASVTHGIHPDAISQLADDQDDDE